MFSLKRVAAIAALASAAVVGACTEKLDGGAACSAASALCPGQALEYRDTIITPVLAFDSTYVGFPSLGAEFFLPLVNIKDTVETAVIVRYDSLTTFYLPPLDTARTITYVDSARLKLSIDLTRAKVPDSVRIDVYDVDDGGTTDTVFAPITARLIPTFRIGGITVPKASVIDSLFVPIRDSVLLAHIRDTMPVTKARMRIGIKVSTPTGGPVVFRIGSVESGAPVQLRYRPSNDTSARALTLTPQSAGPVGRADLRRDLMDIALITKNTLPEFPNTMGLGGLPGRRAYLRFDIPRRLTDSTTVIRATLRLTQKPYPFGGAGDTVVVHPHIVLAGPLVTDYRRASTLIGITGLVITDSLILTPRDSGQRSIELYPLIRQWAVQSLLTSPPPRAVVLTAANEGGPPYRVQFHSTTAGASVRPTLRLTYIPKVQLGVP